MSGTFCALPVPSRMTLPFGTVENCVSQLVYRVTRSVWLYMFGSLKISKYALSLLPYLSTTVFHMFQNAFMSGGLLLLALSQ